MDTIGFGNLKKSSLNGIEFAHGRRLLYFQGQVAAEGVLKEAFQPRRYFYALRFLDDFPQVLWWAFGDAWTQRIMIEPPRRDAAGGLSGFIFFGDQASRGIYIIENAHDPYPPRAVEPGAHGFPPWVHTPLPPLFDVPLNLPLRLVIARAVLGALSGDFPYHHWQTVTSVVERGHVPQILTTDLARDCGFRIKALPVDLRQALCELQGLRA